MPRYRRVIDSGGTFFFTIVTENRAPLFAEERWRNELHAAIADARTRRAFTIDAIVLLSDHLHLILTLPEADADYSTRLASLKASFTRRYLAGGGVEQSRTASRVAKRRRGVWQRWFWEHRIRDRDDLSRHVEYIHFNPVKHGLATCPHTWPYSSFARYVASGLERADWRCACNGSITHPPDPDWANFCEPPE